MQPRDAIGKHIKILPWYWIREAKQKSRHKAQLDALADEEEADHSRDIGMDPNLVNLQKWIRAQRPT